MKLYLTRHGETVWNVEKRLQGWMDSPLTENGIKGAEKLRDRLKNEGIDYIYTSDLKRAVSTAEIIRDDSKIEIELLEDLREIKFGDWEGELLQDIKSKYPHEYNIYLSNPKEYNLISGENIEELFERAYKALDFIVSSGHKRVLIVSHGVTIRAIIAILMNVPYERFKDIPVYAGTSLSVFEGESKT
ncbi:MAG: histidine phosphatase family protein, partial [Gudongella sp.]|nr:histidine phosphatase family protein [Gudongella sp.]